MNCRNFEDQIDDMARGALMDAQTREDALRHASQCGPCATRLDDERSLTAGLRSLASLAADASAPPRVETALLAAFRARHAAASADGNSNAPSVHTFERAPVVAAEVNAETHAPLPFVSRASGSQWWLPRWAQGGAVAAASALLVFGLYAFMRQPSPQPTNLAGKDAPSADTQLHKGVATAPPSAVATADEPTVLIGEQNVPGLDDADDNNEEPKPRLTNRAAPRAGQRLAGGARPNVIDAGYNNGVQNTEIATEFIPLVGGGRLAPGDSGHLMRVEVPRTAMASFGLPVNADTSGGRVKADVLFGEDGIARAIRFVR